jgi:transcriptional regulator with XRE-family HTH domain
VVDAPGETWHGVNWALRHGARGLRGGTSLARLLARRLGARNHTTIARLTVPKVLAWADAHHARTGAWPGHRTGPIPEAPGDTWAGVQAALRQGYRGLPGGTSLYRLLKKHCQVPGPRPALRRSRERSGRRGRPAVRLHFPEEVLDRYRSGELDVRGVATAYGVSLPTARRELERAGVTVRVRRRRPRAPKPGWHRQVLRRYRKGQSLQRIAAALGLTRARVVTVLRQHRIARRPAGPDLFAHGLGPEERGRLAAELKGRRKGAGLTQDELAARAGLTQVTISALETGRSVPTRRTVARLAKVLRLQPGDLLPHAVPDGS